MPRVDPEDRGHVRLSIVTQLIIAVLVVVIGLVVAQVIRRRDASSMAQGSRWAVPAQLERRDFVDPDAERLVVVFTSETCDACAATWEALVDLVGPETAIERVSYQERADLHDRYGIDAVPTLLVADRDGVVQRSFVGPPDTSELVEALQSSPDD